MIHPEEGVNVIHGLCADICELLDLGGGVFDLSKRKEISKAFKGCKRGGVQTSASVRSMPSCSTRDLTAFHPVRRWLKCETVEMSYCI